MTTATRTYADKNPAQLRRMLAEDLLEWDIAGLWSTSKADRFYSRVNMLARKLKVSREAALATVRMAVAWLHGEAYEELRNSCPDIDIRGSQADRCHRESCGVCAVLNLQDDGLLTVLKVRA